ncbi:MAG: Rho-binding antiterminator [Bacteroidia bacterium]|nr:Rho-binding antiterminator [Bacteroidia bacterium]
MAQSSYLPIACHLYDELEIAAMRGRKVNFVLRQDGRSISDAVVDLWAKDGIEYLKLRGGDVFRLDQIASFDEHSLLTDSGEPQACGIHKPEN